jgi:hypothetical protein
MYEFTLFDHDITAVGVSLRAADGDSFYVKPGVVIGSTNDIPISGYGNSMLAVVDGVLAGTNAGLFFVSPDGGAGRNVIRVGEQGTIMGVVYGLHFGGVQALVENQGSIIGQQYAIEVENTDVGTRSIIDNSSPARMAKLPMLATTSSTTRQTAIFIMTRMERAAERRSCWQRFRTIRTYRQPISSSSKVCRVKKNSRDTL